MSAGTSRPHGVRTAVPRSLASTGALVVLVVVVPILLAGAGNPLPRGGWHGLHTLLSLHGGFDSRLATRWLLDGALLLAWATWAWLAVCVGIEVSAWCTGRTPTRLPGSRTMQTVAAFLVGTSLALVSMGRTLPGPPARPSAPRADIGGLRVIADLVPIDARRPADSRFATTSVSPVVGPGLSEPRDPGGQHDGGIVGSVPVGSHPGSVPVGSDRDDLPIEGNLADPPTVREVGGSVHTVVERETLWSIAESRLGTARRWKEVAALNYGVTQADGGSLDATHWIRPGWRLRLPADVPVDVAVEHQRRRGTTVARSDAGRIGVPATAVQGPSAPVTTPESTVPSPAVRAVGGPIELVGAGLVGAGVVALVERKRRAQQRHRSAGSLIPLPDPASGGIEGRLRAGDRGAVREVGAALELLGTRACAQGGSPPELLGVQVGPGTIELVVAGLESLGPIEPPFSLRGERSSLFLDRPVSPQAEPDAVGMVRPGRPFPFPALATVGRGTEGPTMVNLEAVGSLAVRGTGAACDGFVRALALELATSPWAGGVELVLVGFGDELERFTGVEVVRADAPLVHRLDERRFRADRLLADTGFRTYTEARLSGAGTGWDPLVVLCSPDLPEEHRRELVAAGPGPRAGVVVVVAGPDAAGRHVLEVPSGGRGSALDLLGAVVFPQRVSGRDLEEVAALVATADDRRSASARSAPYDRITMPLPRGLGSDGDPSGSQPASARTSSTPGDPDGRPDADDGHAAGPPSGVVVARSHAPSPAVPHPPHPEGGIPEAGSPRPAPASDPAPAGVEVAVLGPVEITGAARPFTRAWARELVVYLAMHPDGATNDRWATALWPDRLMAASSLHSTASVARRALGHAADGRDHLPRSHGRLRLAATVGTDWDRFVRLADAGGTSSARAALALVRGRPFEGLRASDWTILEGIAPAIEAAVVDLAGRLAGALLGQGDPGGAEWAARRGLLVSPYDERLYRMLLRAADAAGNPAGVESVMAELVQLVADDVEPFDSVHPATMELYRSLTRRTRPLATTR